MNKETAVVCTIEAPCKVNLHLSIGEKRPDGYHDLESLFASLAFGDTLRFESGGKKGDCHLNMDWESSQTEIPRELVPREKNLVFKAVSLFRERTGFNSGLRIQVNKRIPAGAGLGGGSSDAASSLLAMNFLSGELLSTHELAEIASILGSDVPFFLVGGAAYVRGRGEIVESVKIPENLWVLLSKPPFSSNTSSAFRLLDEVRAEVFLKKRFSNEKLPKEKLPKEALIHALEDKPGVWPFRNDFLPVFLSFSSESGTETGLYSGIYRENIEALRNTGASFAGLSGSGSCCFGVFSAKLQAEKAEKELSRQGNFTKLTFFLARRPDPVLE